MTTPTADVRFGRLDRPGLILGFSATQTLLLGGALAAVVGAGTITGPVGILAAGPVWVTALVLALVPLGGRPMIEVVPVVVPWLRRRLLRRSETLARPGHEGPALPGIGRMVFGEDAHTGAGTIRTGRGADTYTVVARVQGRSFLLDAPQEQDRRVAAWGRLLGSLNQLGFVAAVQVLHRSVRGEDYEVGEWWKRQQSARSAWAKSVVVELVDETATSATVDSLIAFSLQTRRGVPASSAMDSLGVAMSNAEIDLVAWLTVKQIRRAMRVAFDPGAHPSGPPLAAGPMGVADQWSHVRCDGAVHAVFWISEWPRSATHPGFLRTLMLAPGSNRTVSVIAQPLSTARALKEIRRARAEQIADAATRARIGQVEDQVSRAAAAELTRREEELIAGHGDLRFIGLITVSATTLDELDDACRSLQSDAGQAGCEVRRLVGQQVHAFVAASLPLARGLS